MQIFENNIYFLVVGNFHTLIQYLYILGIILTFILVSINFFKKKESAEVAKYTSNSALFAVIMAFLLNPSNIVLIALSFIVIIQLEKSKKLILKTYDLNAMSSV